jgi:hypothetical protein
VQQDGLPRCHGFGNRTHNLWWLCVGVGVGVWVCGCVCVGGGVGARQLVGWKEQ